MRSMKERQFILAVHFNFSIYAYPSKKVRTIYDITIISASSLAYNSVTSTIGYQHTAENKDLDREGDIIGLLEVTEMVGCLMEIYALRELTGFEMTVLGSTRRPTTFNKLAVTTL